MLNGKIDLRSDTVTQPTAEMREAMQTATVGDDGREGDPTVRILEEMAAGRVGTEAALFVPSGTMGNLTGIMAHTVPGQEIILESSAHIYTSEVGGMARVAGLVSTRIPGTRGVMAPEDVEAAIRPPKLHHPQTGLICQENTHNGAGGTVATLADMKAIQEVARKYGIPLHLDGARLFNAAVALKVEARDIVAHVDSVQFCLSKGLSAPFGSMICGSASFVERARKVRQMLGGGMRQAGVMAAAGMVALETMVDRLAEDHARGRQLAEGLAAIPGLLVPLETVQTNIIRLRLENFPVSASTLAQSLAEEDVLVMAQGDAAMRLVTHRHITKDDVEQALDAFVRVVERFQEAA